jgi:hypothetical protein
MRGGPFHDRLSGERKGDAVLMIGGLGDIGRSPGLLAAEVVRRHADDHQAAVMEARP